MSYTVVAVEEWGAVSSLGHRRPTLAGDSVTAGSRRLPEVVLVDQPVKGLAVYARSLGGRRDVAVISREQGAEVRGLQHGHPALLRILEGQIGSRLGQGGVRPRWYALCYVMKLYPPKQEQVEPGT